MSFSYLLIWLIYCVECDLGKDLNGAPNSGCSKDCKKCPYCGDGIVNTPDEQCDLGKDLNGKPGQPCKADCTHIGECGDGIVDPGEGAFHFLLFGLANTSNRM